MSDTEFLVDHRNHTGYAQTLRETTTNADGTYKTVDYTFGHDEISQTVDDGTTTTTHVFGHDGHGSVRVLYDLATAAANIAQAFTFAAYGEMIALHNATAQSIAVTNRLSSLGYSGEHFDAKAQQQYLRARFYNPANGRFNRLDPFAGNMQDPQSLHKYAYVHGDPIQGADPTGKFVAGLVSVAISNFGRIKDIGAAEATRFVAGIAISSVVGASAGSLLQNLAGGFSWANSRVGAYYGSLLGAGLYLVLELRVSLD